MILVGGENLIDFIQTGVEDGIPTYKAMPGGSPFNVAMAVGRQEVPVGYLTPISSDPLGGLLAARLEDSNVQLLATRRIEPTSLAVVALENGLPSYQFYRERTAERMVTLEGLKADTPDDVQAVYLGSLAITGGDDADAWADYYCASKLDGVFTALDPNIRPAFIHDRTAYEKRLDQVLLHTDLLKFSDEDLNWLVPGADLVEGARTLAARSSAKLVIVTKGGDGAFALDGDDVIEVPPAPVSELKDTVGAGDTFMATLLATLAQRGALSATSLADMSTTDIESLITRAAKAAAINCERSGCNPPRLTELD